MMAIVYPHVLPIEVELAEPGRLVEIKREPTIVQQAEISGESGIHEILDDELGVRI